MPLTAMRRGEVDYVLPVEEMPRVIMGLLMNRQPLLVGSPEDAPARAASGRRRRAHG